MVRNLKPAPFAMTPPIVRQMLIPGVPVSKGMVRIPVLPVVLAEEVKGSITTSSDVPATIRPDCTAAHYNSKSFATPSARMDGPEEPARVAPVPAAPSAPAESPNLGRPDIASPTKRAEKMPLPDLQDVRTKIAVRPPKPVPRLWVDIRREQREAAIRFLKQRGILVTVVDRSEPVRRYRVTGRADSHLHEGVIEIAILHGFEHRHLAWFRGQP